MKVSVDLLPLSIHHGQREPRSRLSCMGDLVRYDKRGGLGGPFQEAIAPFRIESSSAATAAEHHSRDHPEHDSWL